MDAYERQSQAKLVETSTFIQLLYTTRIASYTTHASLGGKPMASLTSGLLALRLSPAFVLTHDTPTKTNAVATMNDLKCFGSALSVARRAALSAIVNPRFVPPPRRSLKSISLDAITALNRSRDPVARSGCASNARSRTVRFTKLGFLASRSSSPSTRIASSRVTGAAIARASSSSSRAPRIHRPRASDCRRTSPPRVRAQRGASRGVPAAAPFDDADAAKRDAAKRDAAKRGETKRGEDTEIARARDARTRCRARFVTPSNARRTRSGRS